MTWLAYNSCNNSLFEIAAVRFTRKHTRKFHKIRASSFAVCSHKRVSTWLNVNRDNSRGKSAMRPESRNFIISRKRVARDVTVRNLPSGRFVMRRRPPSFYAIFLLCEPAERNFVFFGSDRSSGNVTSGSRFRARNTD